MVTQLQLLPLNSGAGCVSCPSKAKPARLMPDESSQDELRALVERAAVHSADDGWLPAGEETEFTLSLDESVPLVAELHHEPVGDQHVWVGVQEAALAVVGDRLHRVVVRLAGGESPRSVAADTGWATASDAISTLAASGLIRGLTGYTHRPALRIGQFARFHLTRACQLECAHCYADSSPHVDRSDELPTSRWLKLVDDFAAQGGEQVLFTGGEALMHDGCLDLMAASRQRGLHVTLFSNGLLVNRLADRIHQAVDQVQISVDGPDAESHDAIRGRNSLKHALTAVDALAERGTPTRLGMTMVPSTWHNWVEKINRLRDRYAWAPHVTFKLSYGVMAYGRGVQINRTEVASKAEVDAFLAEVNGDMSPQITRHKSGCGYAEQLVVGPDGAVYPCHLLDGKVCHIDDMPLPQIIALLSGLLRQVDVDHVEGCRTCEIRYLCGGSCRVLGSGSTGSRLITDCTPEEKKQKYVNLAASFGRSVR